MRRIERSALAIAALLGGCEALEHRGSQNSSELNEDDRSAAQCDPYSGACDDFGFVADAGFPNIPPSLADASACDPYRGNCEEEPPFECDPYTGICVPSGGEQPDSGGGTFADAGTSTDLGTPADAGVAADGGTSFECDPYSGICVPCGYEHPKVWSDGGLGPARVADGGGATQEDSH